MSLSEIIFLGVLGLVIFGPKKLGELAQQAGQIVARLKKVSGDFQAQLATEISPKASERPTESAVTTGVDQ
jgi:Sec-independent protein translocase protein TatA